MLTSKNPSFLLDLFERRPTNYNLRIKDLVQLPSTKTVRYGLNSLRFIGSMLFGDTQLNVASTRKILEATISFIKNTKRFSNIN